MARSRPDPITWLIWLVAPGSFAVVSTVCWFDPDLCSDPPNLLFACVLVFTHSVGGLGAVVRLASPGPHRRAFEFRALLVYAAAIAGWLSIGPTSPVVYWGFVWLANATTATVAVAGLVLVLRGLSARPEV